MREVGYEFAYMFKYSERPDTFAQRHMPDDVPDSVKTARLNEIIALQNTPFGRKQRPRCRQRVRNSGGRYFQAQRRQLFGRTSQNKVVVFDRGECRIGDYVRVRVTGLSSATLQGELVERPARLKCNNWKRKKTHSMRFDDSIWKTRCWTASTP